MPFVIEIALFPAPESTFLVVSNELTATQLGFPSASVPHTSNGFAIVGPVTKPFCPKAFVATFTVVPAPKTAPVPPVTVTPEVVVVKSPVIGAAAGFTHVGIPPEILKICPAVPTPRFTQFVPSKYIKEPFDSAEMLISVPSTASS